MKYIFNAFYYRPSGYFLKKKNKDFHRKGSPVSNFEYPNA